MALVRRGVPAHWLRELASAMDLSRTTLCELLGLKLSTVKVVGEVGLHLHEVLARAIQSSSAAQQAQNFLSSLLILRGSPEWF